MRFSLSFACVSIFAVSQAAKLEAQAGALAQVDASANRDWKAIWNQAKADDNLDDYATNYLNYLEENKKMHKKLSKLYAKKQKKRAEKIKKHEKKMKEKEKKERKRREKLNKRHREAHRDNDLGHDHHPNDDGHYHEED